jgi:hypothetical protein
MRLTDEPQNCILLATPRKVANAPRIPHVCIEIVDASDSRAGLRLDIVAALPKGD